MPNHEERLKNEDSEGRWKKYSREEWNVLKMYRVEDKVNFPAQYFTVRFHPFHNSRDKGRVWRYKPESVELRKANKFYYPEEFFCNDDYEEWAVR